MTTQIECFDSISIIRDQVTNLNSGHRCDGVLSTTLEFLPVRVGKTKSLK